MDDRAVRTLFSTYWSAAGWRPESERVLQPEEFAHARDCGVMFDPATVDHAGIVAAAMGARDAVDSRAVADSFVVSLGTRELDRRSALGSYAVLSHFPGHDWSGSIPSCAVCGGYYRQPHVEDLNVLNFERLKWGGVRHLQPLYATFDLQQFQRLEHAEPRAEQVLLLKELLETIDAAPRDYVGRPPQAASHVDQSQQGRTRRADRHPRALRSSRDRGASRFPGRFRA